MIRSDRLTRETHRFALETDPRTGSMDYTFVQAGVRFLVFDTAMGSITPEQADWAENACADDLPFMILSHVPFPVPTLTPRIRLILRDVMAGHVLEGAARDRVMALSARPGFLGALVGHMHFGSCEDALGNSCQFLTASAAA